MRRALDFPDQSRYSGNETINSNCGKPGNEARYAREWPEARQPAGLNLHKAWTLVHTA